MSVGCPCRMSELADTRGPPPSDHKTPLSRFTHAHARAHAHRPVHKNPALLAKGALIRIVALRACGKIYKG